MTENDSNNNPIFRPQTPANDKLRQDVAPPDWVNSEPADKYNLVVIGAGSGGLVTAAGAAGLGAKVALIERNALGGDCLNVGCVPSKALLSAAKRTAAVRDAAGYGVSLPGGSEVDFPAVMERMRELRASIGPNDSAERFKGLGIDVFLGEGRLKDGATIEVDGKELKFAKAVIATGGRAIVLPIPGLKEAGALTNETLFSLTELPRRFAVIGAGPIGCEMAQAFARLGSEVTLFEAQCKILPREDGNALFKGRKKHTDLLVPWCTYTQPEIAHVGLYDGEAKERHGNAVRIQWTPTFEHSQRTPVGFHGCS